ncbi:MAG: nucleotide exchange factor GrpE [Paracoccaceae bacterium]
MSEKQNNKSEELLSLDELIAEAEEGDVGNEEKNEESTPDLEKLIEERDSLKDKLLRSLADSENLRKRSIRDRSDAEVYGGTKLARDLLSVYDNITRALDAVSDEQREANKALIEGIELTRKELINGFEKHKILRVAPEVGDIFDPLIHQAMFEAPMPDSKAGEIIQIMAVGFKIGDRLLRPAQVGVSSKSN